MVLGKEGQGRLNARRYDGVAFTWRARGGREDPLKPLCLQPIIHVPNPRGRDPRIIAAQGEIMSYKRPR